MKKITEKTKVSLTLKQLRKLVKESRMWSGTIKLKNIRWASDDPKLPKEAEIYVEYPLLDDWEDAEREEWEAIEDAMREEYGTEPSDADIDERDDGGDWDDWDAFEDEDEDDEEEDEDEEDDEEPVEKGPCTYKVKLDRTGSYDFDGLPDFTIDAKDASVTAEYEVFSKIVKKLQDKYSVRGRVISAVLDVLKNGKSVMDELDNWYTDEKLIGRITETFESKSMKKINENTKVTLTFAQIKKLVKEGFKAINNRSKGRIYGSVDITDPVGCERLFAYDIEGETGEVILFGADNKDGVFEVLDELLDREGGTPEAKADFDSLVDSVWNLGDGQKFDAWHENGTFGGVYMRLK